LDFVVEHRVEADCGHLMYSACLGIANPELYRVSSDVDKGKLFSISGPYGVARTSAAGKLNMNLRTIGDVHQLEVAGAGCDAVAARTIVLAVIFGLDSHAGEAQERCRHAGHRREVLPGHQ
jgi:hypothetical protein